MGESQLNEVKYDETPSRLLGVGISNFQTIEDYVWLPLGKLTLFFGPNSAGKSAIVDALEIASSIWSGRRKKRATQSVWEGIDDLEKRHWRERMGGDGLTQRVGRDVRIDLRAQMRLIDPISNPLKHSQIENFFPSLHGRMTERPNQRPMDVLARITVSEVVEDSESWQTRLSLELELDGDPILRCRAKDNGESNRWGRDERDLIAVNLQHPLIQADAGAVEELEDAADREGSPFLLEKGWLRYVDGWELRDGNVLTIELDKAWQSSTSNEAEQFEQLCDFLTQDVGERLAEIARIARVPASRQVPTDEQLTFVFFEDWKDRWMPPIAAEGEDRYRELARQVAAREIEQNHSEGEAETVPGYLRCGLLINGEEVDLPSFVNRMLAGPLFKDKGYQVVGSVFELRRVSSMAVASIVKLSLMDASGREFSFKDVGSGIGYVLPALVEGYQSPQSFIEQPELHLHPALQSRLGDALIEIANQGRSLIIETHSEHLLLRVLRRLRQTTKGAVDPSLAVTPSDVVCLYFDPSPDGPTRVRQLRVTPGGDFMDRWPSGFFDSRDEDLFDE